ncbi:MAG TPA: DUF1800 domain-containing protein [Acetobacteraceae bacterium]|nr:DUF1800 domain-containing protein [Acetobacteraceae bacterium]
MAVAVTRFGLGRRGAESLPADPRRWLASQLDGPDPALPRPGADAAAGLTALREDWRERREGGEPARVRTLFRTEAEAARDRLIETQAGFRERLVWFWANHFTVSLRRGPLHALAFAYVREAIRPHVGGRFADMLLAVARHPAMLLYLDNAASIGPDSAAGRRTGRGLNENFARECLELHTVGRDAGYTQADVTAFAAVLTGWGVRRGGIAPGFAFFPHRHQPGAKTVMGRVFAEGEDGGIAALRWLGTHPATYRRLAAKLAGHFIADDPPPDAVRLLAGVLRDSGGDLRETCRALLRLPEAWRPLCKFRTPFDYAVAVLRALDLPAQARPPLVPVTARLGQPWLSAPLPNGWPEDAADWCDGELLLRRADWALAIAGRATEGDPMDVAQAALGPLLDAGTMQAMRRAGSRREALALLLAGPAFFRR